ncbi:MAG: HAD hydrolase-like protein [Dinghuibacter sp.]|nr:HAD hydrolase-like protein [Dinghuibacter sp.]
MKPIQLAVFDMAGTTVYDNGNVAEAFVSAFKHFGLTIGQEAATRVMGYRKKEAIRLLLDEQGILVPANDHELVERVHDQFIQQMIAYYEHTPDLKEQRGAGDLFRWLQSEHIQVALNTGFVKAITDTILRRLGWHEHPAINAVISSDEVPNGRPFPDMIYMLMEKTGVTEKAAVLKIGDTVVDMLEGKNAGCGLVVGITAGAGRRAELEAVGPHHIIDTLDELPFILVKTKVSV